MHLSLYQGQEVTVVPQELSNHIFGHLEDDFISLRHSSLVCRAWLLATRSYLFHQVALCPKTLISLTTLLEGLPDSTILQFVRRAEVFDISFLSGDYPRFCELLTHFTSNVTHLRLKNILFDKFLDLLDTICPFSQLQYLALDKVQWQESLPAEHPALRRRCLPPHLDDVSLRNTDIRQLMVWMMAHSEVPKVSRFDAGPLKKEDILLVTRYLFELASCLKYFSVSYGFSETVCIFGRGHAPDHSNRDQSPVLNRYSEDFCPVFPNLHTVRFSHFLDSASPSQSTAKVWAPRILTAIQSDEIRHVIFGIVQCRAGDLDQHNIKWDFFDKTFATKIFVNLTSVEFEISGKVNIDGLASLISSRLPIAAKRGLLEFRRVD